MTSKYSMFGPIRAALGRAMDNRVVQNAAIAGAPVALGLGVGAAASAYKRMKRTKELASSYRDMMSLHPQLQSADPEKVKRYFGTLSRFNPMMASDPTVAGAWLNNIIDNETHLTDMSGGQALLRSVTELAGIRNNLATAAEREAGRGGIGQEARAFAKDYIAEGKNQEAAELRAALQRSGRMNEAFLAETRNLNKDTAESFSKRVRERVSDPLRAPRA